VVPVVVVGFGAVGLAAGTATVGLGVAGLAATAGFAALPPPPLLKPLPPPPPVLLPLEGLDGGLFVHFDLGALFTYVGLAGGLLT
jgi:hypothetical protein